MGIQWSTPKKLTSDQKNKAFLHEKCHKTYVVTTPGCTFVKVGYTNRTLAKGVWGAYRRAYGNDLIILRVYKASKFKEDEDIHRKLHPTHGLAEKGREIYDRKKLKDLLKELDKWHGNKGSGPFTKPDILHYNKLNKVDDGNTEEIISGMRFLKIYLWFFD